MLFVPHGTIKGPCSFYYFFYFLEARSQVFFLANFCGYWLWDLQAPVARGCMEPHAAAARSVARHANRKAAEGREFFLLWSVCFSMRRRLDGSRLARVFPTGGQFVIRGVTVRHGRATVHPRALRCLSRARLVLNTADKRKTSGNLPVRWLL